MSDPVRVLLVDDHPVVRAGMRQFISEDDTLSVVAEAATGKEAVKIVETIAVDVVVTDYDMPGMDGIQLASIMLRHTPAIPVVLLTVHENEHLFNEAMDQGVSGYLLKDEVVSSINEGIRSVAEGNFYVSPSLSKYIARRSKRSAELQNRNSGLASLTKSERTILALVAENRSSKEIAAELGLSVRTVTTHRTNISHKLGLTGKHPLLNFALANRSAILSFC